MADPTNYYGLQQQVTPVQSFGQGYQLGDAIQQTQMARQTQALQLQQAQSMQKDFNTVAANPTPDGITQLSIKYPQFAEHLAAPFKNVDAKQKQNMIDSIMPVYTATTTGNTDIAINLLTKQAEALSNSGDTKGAESANAYIDMLKNNPKQGSLIIGSKLANAMGLDKFTETYKGLGSEKRANDLAPAELSAKNSDAVIKEAEANVAPKLNNAKADEAVSLADKAATDAHYEPEKLSTDIQSTKADIQDTLNPSAKDDKPPTNYKWTDDTHTVATPIKGGPADPASQAQTPMGVREQVTLGRMVNAANETDKALQNIVNLPLSTSRGFFGGRQQGGSLLSAGKETLTNKMTSQDVQSYNVLSSGIQRNLSAIEAAGLAPSGSLTHSMDSIIFKDGDTNFTKLQKLAEIKQITTAGLEVLQANPRIPQKQMDQINKIVDSINKSVPFSQLDLIKLQQLQDVSPNITIKNVIDARKKDEEDANAKQLASHPPDIQNLLKKYAK